MMIFYQHFNLMLQAVWEANVVSIKPRDELTLALCKT
jgi:hypothetical protein